ncbi:hypothetical protein WMY93_015056 [Mugilogobius chulae]|uniref:Ferric-chelate reductase 1 n=1 Tax=Mugilogobius chulae TaxID=88201 RepID=A0AAW0P3C5_9GOBI
MKNNFLPSFLLGALCLSACTYGLNTTTTQPTPSNNATQPKNATEPPTGVTVTHPINATQPLPGINVTHPMNATQPPPGIGVTDTINLTQIPTGINVTHPMNATQPPPGTPVTRGSCGSTDLCAAEPPSCDPASNSNSCFFLGTRREHGRDFEMRMSGQSAGYVGCTLESHSGRNVTFYICANDNGRVRMITAIITPSGQIIIRELPVNRVRGRVNGNQIQCTFFVTVPDEGTVSTDTTFAVGVVTGDYNAVSNSVGTPITPSGQNLWIFQILLKISPTQLQPTPPQLHLLSTPQRDPTTPGIMTTIQYPVTRGSCGSTDLCAAEPPSCDPASNSNSCFFLGTRREHGRNFEMRMSGQSAGYVGCTLESHSGRNVTFYICANDNGRVRMITAIITPSGQIIIRELPVNRVRGRNVTNVATTNTTTAVPTTTTTAAPTVTPTAAPTANTTGDATSTHFSMTGLMIIVGLLSLLWL